MQPLLLNSTKNTSVSDFQIRDSLISLLKNRFSTYGYKQVRTATFEHYDLYTSNTGTINKDDMIKVIDSSGNVLVLRPDVTIPITRMKAANKQNHSEDSRVFYVLDVFRQPAELQGNKETTQAGIENFCESTPENDAEVIALAVHTLQDLKFESFKLEVGHAGFFKELIHQLALSQNDSERLQALIQSKNLAEMEPFVNHLSVDQNLKDAVMRIPLLYGAPADVIGRAEKIALNETMKQKVKNLRDVYEVLKAYGIEDSVVFDLGLINHMNYYTGVIFQGFAASFGKPVLMGGRYNHLAAEQFNTSIPAIGFACEIDNLLDSMTEQSQLTTIPPPADLFVFYGKERQKEALSTACSLRNEGFRVITNKMGNHNQPEVSSSCTAYFDTEQNLFQHNSKKKKFSSYDELFQLLQAGMGDNEWTM